MKSPASASFILLVLALGAAPASAVDFIRQIQLINGQTVIYDTPVSGSSGQILSKPVTGDGAIFQLYAYKDSVHSPYSLLDTNVTSAVHANVSLASHLLNLDLLGIHLDITLGGGDSPDAAPDRIAEKLVGTYIPDAVIRFTSEDPHVPARTRADKPYDVSIAIRDLPDADAEVPPGAPTRVLLYKDYKLYARPTYQSAPNGSGQGTYSDAIEFSRNGDFHIPQVYQHLPSRPEDDPRHVVGEETYRALVRTNESGAMATIAASTIRIWPQASAEIEINAPASPAGHPVFKSIPRHLKARLTELYPKSRTYAHLYQGAYGEGKSGHIIASSVIAYDTYAPQNAEVPLAGLEPAIAGFPPPAPGVPDLYTIEIVTVTPFNNQQPETITHVTFELDARLRINGSLSSLNP